MTRPAPARFPYFEHRTLAEVDIDAWHRRMLGQPLRDAGGDDAECNRAAALDPFFHASEVR